MHANEKENLRAERNDIVGQEIKDCLITGKGFKKIISDGINPRPIRS